MDAKIDKRATLTLPRLVIAAPMSGSGKTTVVAGLIAALAARGLQVAPFKVGPDYIDPTYHALAANRPCHNLDPWMLAPDQVVALFARQAQSADIALIEGAMGLFDGAAGDSDHGSAAHIARLTQTPVLLVMDARAMSRTAAALLLGLCAFEPQVRIGGVILNCVGSERHARMIQDAIEQRLEVPVVGYVTRTDTLHLPERHLGLIPTTEPGYWSSWLQHTRARIEATVDLDQIIALARSAPPLEINTVPIPSGTRPTATLQNFAVSSLEPVGGKAGVQLPTIAVARDEAFSFLYSDNLDLLESAGAQLAFFSPLHDVALPPTTAALYLCGGFPEVYAATLAQNTSLMDAVRRAATAGMPIYAECGGLMLLTEAIVDLQDVVHPMAGILPGRSHMTGKITLGYRTLRAVSDSWLWRANEEARGHEFHYSQWRSPQPSLPPAYHLLPGPYQSETRPDGACLDNIFATYIHLFFRSVRRLPARFVAAASRFQLADTHTSGQTNPSCANNSPCSSQ